jgi:hypothetical protein
MRAYRDASTCPRQTRQPSRRGSRMDPIQVLIWAAVIGGLMGIAGVLGGVALQAKIDQGRQREEWAHAAKVDEERRVRDSHLQAIRQTKQQVHAWMADALSVAASGRGQPAYGAEVFPDARFALIGEGAATEQFLTVLTDIGTREPKSGVRMSDLQRTAAALNELDRAFAAQTERVNRGEPPRTLTAEETTQLGAAFGDLLRPPPAAGAISE